VSGLEDLYREIILDHYRAPRNRGELASPPAHRVEGFNPLCGDEIVVYLQLDDDRLTAVTIAGQGCSISQASASMMSEAVKGKTVAEIRDLTRSFKALLDVDGEHQPVTDGAVGKTSEPADATSPPAVLATTEELGELAALQGVVKFPVRIKCATLSWNTLLQGIEEIERTASEQ
jgi:nitrogen fixation NifU-like protein